MKQYKKLMRFDFKIAVHGHGKNIKEALFDAAQALEDQVQFDFNECDFDAIERHELIDVTEKD